MIRRRVRYPGVRRESLGEYALRPDRTNRPTSKEDSRAPDATEEAAEIDKRLLVGCARLWRDTLPLRATDAFYGDDKKAPSLHRLTGCEREGRPRREVSNEVQTCAMFECDSSRLVLFAQAMHGQRFEPGGHTFFDALMHPVTAPVAASVVVQKLVSPTGQLFAAF